MKTRLTIVRHGETEWNVAMRLQGMQNSNLTERGIQQAKQAALALKNKKFHRIITSDLRRAVETAKLLNEYHHLNIETSKSIRERNFGIMEGLTREEIQEKYPETYQGYMHRKETYQIPEGESLVDFYARVVKGFNAIAGAHQGEEILVVTHGGVLDCMMRMIFDYPLSSPRRFSIFNASINVFSLSGDDWKLETWGNIDFQNEGTLSLEEPR